jgi:NhaP-type Na+/H+ and K+/H+ antiporter
MDEGLVLLLVGVVLAASVLVALGAARTGLPVLVAFLALGMLLGSDGPGGIEFDDVELASRGSSRARPSASRPDPARAVKRGRRSSSSTSC